MGILLNSDQLTDGQIREALDTLNWHYGKGDIVNVAPLHNGMGKFQRRPFGLQEETRTYQVKGRTVCALGHQRTIKHKVYKSLSAQQAQEQRYGEPDYWDYLEKAAAEHLAKGVTDAFTRSLADCLRGNDGI